MSYEIVKEGKIKKDGKIVINSACNNVTPKYYYSGELEYTVPEVLENDDTAKNFIKLILSGSFKYNANAKDYLHYIFVRIKKLARELRFNAISFYEKEKTENFEENLKILIKEVRYLLEEKTEEVARNGYLKFTSRTSDKYWYYVTDIRSRKGYLEDFKYSGEKVSAEPKFTIIQKELLEEHYPNYKFKMEWE